MVGWTTDTWTALLTGFGALGTAVMAGIIYWQVSSAGNALYGNNAYAVQKDLVDAYGQLSEDEDEIAQQGNNDNLKLKLSRHTVRFDTLFEAVEALYNNNGISLDTWKYIVKTTCPVFYKNKTPFKFGDTPLPGIEAACERSEKLWRDPPR